MVSANSTKLGISLTLITTALLASLCEEVFDMDEDKALQEVLCRQVRLKAISDFAFLSDPPLSVKPAPALLPEGLEREELIKIVPGTLRKLHRKCPS